jgi:AraC-like DNA-binding protein
VKLDLPKDREFDAGVWYSTHASTWYPTHYHEELELKIVLWGSTMYHVGSQRVELGPGSQLWLAPGQPHTLVEVSNDLAMWVASFREDTVRLAERASGVRVLDRPATWGLSVLPAAHLRELSKLSSEVALLHQPREFNAMAHRLLVHALSTCHSHEETEFVLPLKPNGALHPAVARAVALLRELEEDLSLRDLARRCGLSATRLSRLFKVQMGLSLVQYRTHFRVQRFIKQFGRGDRLNMLEAALRAGFGSYAQFHRAFWQVTGYAPSEHLRRVRSGVVTPVRQGSDTSPTGLA